jgi:hypothetical protein
VFQPEGKAIRIPVKGVHRLGGKRTPIRAFVRAVWSHWLLSLGSAAFTILGIGGLVMNMSRQWAIYSSFALAAACLVAAFYRAFKSEYLERMDAQDKSTMQEIHGGALKAEVARLKKEIDDLTG